MPPVTAPHNPSTPSSSSNFYFKASRPSLPRSLQRVLAKLLTHPLVVPLISYAYAAPFLILWARVRLASLLKGKKMLAPIAPTDDVAAALLNKEYGAHKYLEANGLRFHYVEAGHPSSTSPLVLFLHGKVSWKGASVVGPGENVCCKEVVSRGFCPDEHGKTDKSTSTTFISSPRPPFVCATLLYSFACRVLGYCASIPRRHPLSPAPLCPPSMARTGFPEFWYSWRHQLHFLGSHGFHAVALDMRGYGWTDKPDGRTAEKEEGRGRSPIMQLRVGGKG